MDPNCGRHTGDPDDLLERRRGSRAPLASKSGDRGRGWGPIQHSRVQSGRSWRWVWWCRGQATVVSAAMVTATAVAWADDAVQQCNDQISKFPSRHSYRLILATSSISLCSHGETLLTTCYE
jgi:hypothetical protein